MQTGGTTSATQVHPEHASAVRMLKSAYIQSVGSETIIDAIVTDTPIFINNSNSTNGTLAGSLVLSNIKLSNVPIAVGVSNGSTVLAGGTTTIESWGQGNVYSGTNPEAKFTQGPIQSVLKSKNLVDNTGKIFQRGQPQYEAYAVDQFVSVKDEGAKGDGKTDDTASLNAIMKKVSPLA